MENKKDILISISLSFVFFVIAFLTLGNYGVSWDEAIHFRRGQAYLNYFLTGEKDFNNLPTVNLQGTNGDPSLVTSPRRSFYQNDIHTAEYFLSNDTGHPPLNDYAAAALNYIFYQKLGIMGDIESHHLFNILSSSILVFVVVAFAYRSYGMVAAIVSFLTLITYPLFWSESHFNIKDPALAAFYASTIWCFYESIKKYNIRWLSLSIIAFAIALSIKFNILFAPLVFILYFLLIKKFKINFAKNKKYFSLLAISPLLISLFFVWMWPYVSTNFPDSLLTIFGYYKQIGTGSVYQPASFYIFGFNTFPSLWFIFTTPPIVLLLLMFSLIKLLFFTKNRTEVAYLWLIWLIVPFVRVTLPGTAIYGGIRQIFEFIPALALLAGYAASEIVRTKTKTRVFILLLSFVWPVLVLIKLHPYENTYFNFLIGGIQGAKDRNFPSWGNTFGTAYYSGIEWLNKNVEQNAKVSLLQGTEANAPLIYFRRDINFSNQNFSGIHRDGEYIMELIFNDTGKDFHYAWEYVEKFLTPVYELKVDNVVVLRIWKNDLQHTKEGFKLMPRLFTEAIKTETEKNYLTLSFKKNITLSNIVLKLDKDEMCKELTDEIFVETYADGAWHREKDWVPHYQVGYKNNIEDRVINFYFAARQTRDVRFVFGESNECIPTVPEIEVFTLN